MVIIQLYYFMNNFFDDKNLHRLKMFYFILILLQMLQFIHYFNHIHIQNFHLPLNYPFKLIIKKIKNQKSRIINHLLFYII